MLCLRLTRPFKNSKNEGYTNTSQRKLRQLKTRFPVGQGVKLSILNATNRASKQSVGSAHA
jgi:hypothetical protein